MGEGERAVPANYVSGLAVTAAGPRTADWDITVARHNVVRAVGEGAPVPVLLIACVPVRCLHGLPGGSHAAQPVSRCRDCDS